MGETSREGPSSFHRSTNSNSIQMYALPTSNNRCHVQLDLSPFIVICQYFHAIIHHHPLKATFACFHNICTNKHNATTNINKLLSKHKPSKRIEARQFMQRALQIRTPTTIKRTYEAIGLTRFIKITPIFHNTTALSLVWDKAHKSPV